MLALDISLISSSLNSSVPHLDLFSSASSALEKSFEILSWLLENEYEENKNNKRKINNEVLNKEFDLLLLFIALYLWFIINLFSSKIFFMSNKFKNISVISTGSWVPSDINNQKNTMGTYEVQINELTLMASIGIHKHEKIKKQRVRISLSIQVIDNLNIVDESIDNVVSYEKVIKNLKEILSTGHIELLETLGEKISDMCFNDKRILRIWMKLEKLDVFSDAKSVGIEIVKDKKNYSKKKSSNLNIEKILEE